MGPRLLAIRFAIGLTLLLGAACAGSGKQRIQADTFAPPGTLRMALVVVGATREEVVALPELHQLLLSAGVKDEEIVAGSVVQLALHCCDGPDTLTYGVAYAPPSVPVQRGDIVEIRVASAVNAQGLDRLNVVTRVREVHDTTPSHCTWVPQEEGLWRRTLHCDWMEAEGWTEIRSWGLPVVYTKRAGSP